ncbi:MAG: hypothetical protein ACD_50C00143G0003 [uncultured bacterium]|nr:MAG: hypothetical protein ACD_50C00143G0003 [uncultured bacterium]OGH14617.1 MAG: DNA polymerase III subunit beta [Candidatus Levybacteria bacterium RIFCSPHIGHO2_01_FULL_38_26]
MRTSLLSEKLQEKLQLVNHAISNKNQLPILLNFLIKAQKGSLTISATDLEIGIKVEIPANTEENGETTVPAKTFLELINTIPAGKIILGTKKEGLELLGEKIKTIFQTVSSDEFPKLYEERGGEALTISKNIIKKDLPKIVFATSQDLTRPALSGVLIRNDPQKDEGLLMVATDGYRLSIKKYNSSGKDKIKESISVIIPGKVLRELILINKGNDEIKTYVSKEINQVVFFQNDTTLVGRLIEGEFPAFEKIIPQGFSVKTIFDKEDLERAVKACYIFARNAANIVKLSIQKDKMIASASTPSLGQNTIEIEAKTTGEENEIAFNCRYLLDFLSNIGEETLSFEMTGPLNPGVFKISGDDSFLHLIMPIRIQEET